MLLFYDHIIDKRETLIIIDSLDIPVEKKSHFKALIDDILHSGIVEYILSKLQPRHHKTFLYQLEKAPHDPELLAYLRTHITEDIEDQIRLESARLLRLLHKDLTQ